MSSTSTTLVLERLGHLAVDDALRQAFDDRGLAHPRFADQHRDCSWSGAAGSGWCAGSRRRGRSPGRACPGALARSDRGCTCARASRWPSASWAADALAAAHRLDRPLQVLPGRTVLLEQPSGLALVLGQGEQEQLGGDELVAALLGFLVGQVEQVRQARARRSPRRRGLPPWGAARSLALSASRSGWTLTPALARIEPVPPSS